MGTNDLPKGKWNDAWGYYEESNKEYGTNENNDPPYKAEDLTKKCCCGASKTYGKDIEGWMHSDYCKLYEKKEK